VTHSTPDIVSIDRGYSTLFTPLITTCDYSSHILVGSAQLEEKSHDDEWVEAATRAAQIKYQDGHLTLQCQKEKG
jgi:hypothetical protein